MQSVSAAFTSACQAAVRYPQQQVSVAWDGANYTDESGRVLAWDVDSRLAAPGDELVNPGDVATGSIRLANEDGRYSWRNTSGALAAHIGGAIGLGGKPVRVRVGFDGESVTVFTGVITGWNEDDTARVVSVKVADVGYVHLQKKTSTAVFFGLRADQWIQHLATLAGIYPNAQLDTSLHVIPYLWLDDESLLDEIWSCANADGGRAYFDELGTLRYENPTHWLGHSRVWTFALADEYQLQPTFATDALAKEVVAEWSARVPGMSMIVYTLDALKAVRPDQNLDLEARFQYPVVGLIPPEAGTDYVIASGSGATVEGVTVSILESYAQRATIRVANGHASKTAVINHLQLRGWPLLGGPTDQVRVAAASDPMGHARVRSIRGNPYCQTEAQAKTLASTQAARAANIQATWPLSVNAVPQLQLGDKVAIAGRSLSSIVDGFVVRNALRFSERGGLQQDIDVFDASGLYPYTNYYVIGQTALGGAGGRVWF